MTQTHHLWLDWLPLSFVAPGMAMMIPFHWYVSGDPPHLLVASGAYRRLGPWCWTIWRKVTHNSSGQLGCSRSNPLKPWSIWYGKPLGICFFHGMFLLEKMSLSGSWFTVRFNVHACWWSQLWVRWCGAHTYLPFMTQSTNMFASIFVSQTGLFVWN